MQEQAAITAYLKYSPAGSLSSDDPHLLSDPACENLLHSYFSTSKNIPDVSNVSGIPNNFDSFRLSNGLPLPTNAIRSILSSCFTKPSPTRGCVPNQKP